MRPKASKEGSNKNGNPFVSFVGEYTRRGVSKPSTMLHTAPGESLASVKEQIKDGQPIRVSGVMPADGERKAKQILRLVGKSLRREKAAEKMQQAA